MHDFCVFHFRDDTDSRKNESASNFQELTSSICDVYQYFRSLGGVRFVNVCFLVSGPEPHQLTSNGAVIDHFCFIIDG